MAAGKLLSHRVGAALAVGLLVAASAAAAGPTEPSQREIVRRAMLQRPGDPWPRGRGHVVLGVPGSQQPQKAYHEPGGSFSPAVGSFGVSLWVVDGRGSLRATSDTIPLADLRQRLVWPNPSGVPGIATQTPYYEAQWSWGWSLALNGPKHASDRLWLVVRSVGPAGGPVRRLAWDGKRLELNGRWSLVFDPPPKAVHLGHEGDPGWKTEPGSSDRWQGDDGWGYARIELARGSSRVRLHDFHAPSEPANGESLAYPAVRSTLQLSLPDARFVDSLHAQAAHLMMGLLDRRIPPGEPTNYPLAWERDGAVVLASLARAGQLDLCRPLAEYFAENDFFGGFGAEADAPGTSLWAIEEVACRRADPAWDRWLWPHVRRKAELILRMRRTAEPIRLPYTGPIVPAHRAHRDLDLVCDPPRRGLIAGRMDWHQPLLYVNAVSFLGLLSAADLAERLQARDDATRWRTEAEAVRKAWLDAFNDPEWNNERTYICGLWPSGVAAANRQGYLDQLEKRCGQGWGRPWTYFTAAMAHQYLLLDRPDRVWKHLEWFWANQTSPGLYTWWEGTGEENTFKLWEQVRGWVAPAHVTPHYWTAGEVLALQVDMLAYVDRSSPGPVLVIGGGVPARWLDKPMQVAGLPTCLGPVDWHWRDHTMTVTLRRSDVKVRLGAAFPRDARVVLRPR